MKILNPVFASVALAIFLGQSTIASAMPITLESEWQHQRFGMGTLTFTYDDQTPDSNFNPLFGKYYRSILALDFVFDDISFRLDTWEPNSIDIKVQQPSGANILLTGSLIGSDKQRYGMYFGLEIHELWTGGVNSLDTLIGAIADENSSNLAGWLLMKTAFTVKAPEPASFGLLALGLAGLSFVRRKVA